MGDGRPFYCASSSVEAASGEFKENGLKKEPSEISQEANKMVGGVSITTCR